MFPRWFENKIFAVLAFFILASLLVFLAYKINESSKTTQYIGEAQVSEHILTVSGEARISDTPDLATITIGLQSKSPDVSGAQKANSDTMNPLIERVKDLGVLPEDIQTSNYRVYEDRQYDQAQKKTVSIGWVVDQSIVIKIRELDKVATVLEIAGQNGATSISGPNLTIEDPNRLQDAARNEAIANAKQKAQELSLQLGINLEAIIGYNEWFGEPPVAYRGYSELALDMGGGAAPNIELGSEEGTMHVDITYRIAN
ncbi:MAG: SIMPL domain-containing protein [bacterium]|nr:SIMPL domain-containing protein [bacterium]